jgi:hypothetical protein
MVIETVFANAEHMVHRLVQDAFAEYSPRAWTSRAEAFETAAPRPGDFVGWATHGDTEDQRQRIASVALACRRHAQLLSEQLGAC